MSLWVDVSGEIRGVRLSVRKAINDFFDEVAIDSLPSVRKVKFSGYSENRVEDVCCNASIDRG